MIESVVDDIFLTSTKDERTHNHDEFSAKMKYGHLFNPTLKVLLAVLPTVSYMT